MSLDQWEWSSLPGVGVGESEEEADTVLHTAAQAGLAEAEEHAVTHTPVSQQLAQNT